MEQISKATFNVAVSALLLSAAGAMLCAPVSAADAYLSNSEGHPI